jgi:DNA-binding response OmpR family regulator
MMNKKLSILIIEDEAAIRTGLIDVLVFHGYAVDHAADGRTGLHKAISGKYDLILLDVMLPEMNGFDICNRVREQDKTQPIIMLTAKSGDEDIIRGLTLGADDYVAKPFSVAQLILRIQAVLRRSRAAVELGSKILLGGNIQIDTSNLSGRRGNETLAFTRREIEILQYLQAHGERPVSREELLNKVWGYDKNLELETRTVDIHIAKLRRKLEPEGDPRYLVTVRGAGYRLLSE